MEPLTIKAMKFTLYKISLCSYILEGSQQEKVKREFKFDYHYILCWSLLQICLILLKFSIISDLKVSCRCYLYVFDSFFVANHTSFYFLYIRLFCRLNSFFEILSQFDGYFAPSSMISTYKFISSYFLCDIMQFKHSFL